MGEGENYTLGIDDVLDATRRKDFSDRMKEAHRRLDEKGIPNRNPEPASEVESIEANPILGVDILSDDQQRADFTNRMKEAHRRLDGKGIPNR